MPIKLFNYAPEMPDHPLVCIGKVGGWYKFEFRIKNIESGLGQDDLHLDIDVSPPLIHNGSGPPGDIQPGWALWHPFFKNKTGSYKVSFTVTDSFGKSNNTEEWINIPCP